MNKIGIICVAFVVLAGCAAPPPDATCVVDSVSRHDNDVRPLQMATVADGRWCTFSYHTNFGAGPQAYVGGRVVSAPAGGVARVVDVDGVTKVEYQARKGYSGPDAFAVELGQRKIVLRVAVDVHDPASATLRASPETALSDTGHDPVTQRAP